MILLLAVVGLAICYLGVERDKIFIQWLGASLFMAALASVPYGGIP